MVSLPASRWLTAYVDHHSRSLNKHVPEELNHDGLRSTAAQLFKQSMLVPFSAPENDIWEYWPCCYGNPTKRQLNKMETLQKSQGTGQTNSRHWHQSHRRLTSDSHLLHYFKINCLSRNDLLPRYKTTKHLLSTFGDQHARFLSTQQTTATRCGGRPNNYLPLSL